MAKFKVIYKDVNTIDDIKFKKLGWAGHIVGMEEERIPPPRKRCLMGNSSRQVQYDNQEHDGTTLSRGMNCRS